MFEEMVILHLVRPEDLNHHGTLFAGQMSKWLVETGLIATARLLGKPENVVCAQIHGMTFMKPINNGDLIEIKTRIAYLGRTSITVFSEIYANNDTSPSVSSMATFVSVDKQNRPYEHGFKLTDEYVAQNREICENALKVRRAR